MPTKYLPGHIDHTPATELAYRWRSAGRRQRPRSACCPFPRRDWTYRTALASPPGSRICYKNGRWVPRIPMYTLRTHHKAGGHRRVPADGRRGRYNLGPWSQRELGAPEAQLCAAGHRSDFRPVSASAAEKVSLHTVEVRTKHLPNRADLEPAIRLAYTRYSAQRAGGSALHSAPEENGPTRRPRRREQDLWAHLARHAACARQNAALARSRTGQRARKAKDVLGAVVGASQSYVRSSRRRRRVAARERSQ